MDTYDYQRSSLPSRLPAQRGATLPSRALGPAPGGEGTSPSPLSVRAVLRASRRYWWLILALWTVGVSGTGAAIYLKIQPKFRANSLLKVDPNVMELYGMSNSGGGSSYMQTYVELIRSPSVFSRALVDEKVSQLPMIRSSADAMQDLKAIQVAILPSTTIIEVSMTANSQAEAATIVNAVVAAFLDYNKSWSGNTAKAQIKLLEGHAATLKAEGDEVTRKLKELAARGAKAGEARVVRESTDNAEATTTRAAETGMNVTAYERMVENFYEIQTNEFLAKAQLIEAEQAVKESQSLASVGAPQKQQIDAQLEHRINFDPEVRTLSNQRNDVYQRYEAARGKAVNGIGDPGVQAAAKRVRTLDQQLALAKTHARERILNNPAAGSDLGSPSLVSEVRRLQAEVRHLGLKRDTLEKQLKTYKLETNKQIYDEVEARILDERRRFVESNANIIRNKLESLKMEQMNDERIHMIDAAREEGAPFSDKRKLYLAATPFGVLGVVLALAIILEIRSGRVADTESLSARLPHEVFAIAPLPSARGALGFRGDRSEQGLARFVQSLDHLRVALCEGGTNGEGRCVMITSATGGEGKTTLSAHLAARCANAGTATLLIDADLRRGSLGRLLDVPAGHGLGDVLAGQVELDGGLITTQAGGFHFLSAGTPGIDPTRVLRSTRLAELIGQLRQMYDLIIVDTPPVLPVPDALILGRWSDGAVMAARYDASRVPMVERANRQIAAAGIPVLGVVVNGAQGQDQVYGNYAYNYDYPGSREPSADDAVAS